MVMTRLIANNERGFGWHGKPASGWRPMPDDEGAAGSRAPTLGISDAASSAGDSAADDWRAAACERAVPCSRAAPIRQCSDASEKMLRSKRTPASSNASNERRRLTASLIASDHRAPRCRPLTKAEQWLRENHVAFQPSTATIARCPRADDHR